MRVVCYELVCERSRRESDCCLHEDCAEAEAETESERVLLGQVMPSAAKPRCPSSTTTQYQG